jgi:hypothetical protein
MYVMRLSEWLGREYSWCVPLILFKMTGLCNHHSISWQQEGMQLVHSASVLRERKKGLCPMERAYKEIIEQIQAKCQRDNWYGPTSYRHRRAGWARPMPFETGFAFPPATEQELQETERLLGFTLPPLLRAMYENIANGGFGPGGGIRGAINGYGRPATFESGSDETILTQHLDRERLIDLRDYAGQWRRSPAGDQLLLPSDVWPQQLVPICDLGCQQEVSVDQKGQTFLWYPSEEDDYLFTLNKETTFEQWIRAWLEAQ